jgi:uncharacterized double-CXXCG motif protein
VRYYWLQDVSTPQYSGEYLAGHKWLLPGITCPTCRATWGVAADSWPCVDLTSLPDAAEMEARLEEDYSEFERLREKVRPFVPPGSPLRPGTSFGPLIGQAKGQFGEVFMQNPWTLMMRRGALERLQAEGLKGLQGCPTELSFQDESPPELVELQAVLQGQLHPDCLPPDRSPPCARCGRAGIRLPDAPILDRASLPEHTDLFRLVDFSTMIIGTERLVETLQRLQYREFDVQELPLR